MKELSIEEKTNDSNYKAYTELINRLEDVKDAIKKQNYGIAMDILCKPYPEFQITTSTELKENKDEKIRKQITGFITYSRVLDETKKNWLAWLEAQGEHANFRNSIQVGDKVTRNQDGVLVNLSQLERVAKPAEKQGSQILANSAKTCKDEQKPAWSEEDETGLTNTIIMLKEGANLHFNKKDVTKAVDWLKSLKDRVLPQPKQEWSEEDEQTFIKSVEALEDFGKFELADWLKEHKDQFLKPQNAWKPSDEQIEALWSATEKYLESDNENVRKLRGEVLGSLYVDLKKLK